MVAVESPFGIAQRPAILKTQMTVDNPAYSESDREEPGGSVEKPAIQQNANQSGA
jgi:hypothetical protein